MVHRQVKRHHWWLLPVAAVAVVSATVIAAHSGTPAASGDCSLAHIYNVKRLDVKGCQTVTGSVEVVRVEADGDYHVLLKPDPQFQSLVNSVNAAKQHNDLVIEDVCSYVVTQSDAVSSCQGYHSPFAVPKVGHRYEIRGNYVLDKDHGGWSELHGLVSIKEI